MYSVKKLTELFNKNPLLNRQIYTSHGGNGMMWIEHYLKTIWETNSTYLASRTVTVNWYKYGMDKNNPKLIALKLFYLSNSYDKGD